MHTLLVVVVILAIWSIAGFFAAYYIHQQYDGGASASWLYFIFGLAGLIFAVLHMCTYCNDLRPPNKSFRWWTSQ